MYPDRDQFFAHKFVRLLHKSCAAMDIGQAACLLLCYVAHTEDAARYSGPVRFWNEQLMSVLGFKSPKQLADARTKAVEAGWLMYERSGNREVGRYFVTVPDGFEGLDDAAIEDNRSVNHSADGMNSGMNSKRKAERERNGSRNENETESGKPSNPIPNPIPDPIETQDAVASQPSVVKKPVKRFVKPSAADVAEYIAEIGASVDPNVFVDYYESNGWIVGKAHMKDWKATVRRWNANERERKTNGQPVSANQARENRNASTLDKFRRAAVAAGFIEGGNVPSSAGAIDFREANGGTYRPSG